jgi:hypothetical protein
MSQEDRGTQARPLFHCDAPMSRAIGSAAVASAKKGSCQSGMRHLKQGAMGKRNISEGWIGCNSRGLNGAPKACERKSSPATRACVNSHFWDTIGPE